MNNQSNFPNIEVLKRHGTGFKLHNDLLFIDGNLYITEFKKEGVVVAFEAGNEAR